MTPPRTRPSTRRAPRGFSLIELLVASAVVVIIIGGASLSLSAQVQNLKGVDQRREMSASARDATFQLESALRRAGWGVDPSLAIDVTVGCTAGSPCRDSVEGPDSLAFVSRNPSYLWVPQGSTLPGATAPCAEEGGCTTGNAWRIEAVTPASVGSGAGSVTVSLPEDYRLGAGRMLLALCPQARTPVVLTLQATTEGTGDPVALSTEAIQHRYNAPQLLEACHGQPGALLFLVDRSRYYVARFDGMPWLMLDTGTDVNGDDVVDTNDHVPVARGVDDMQVAYVLFQGVSAPDLDKDWIVGNTKDKVEDLDQSLVPPALDAADSHSSRATLHPANVRAVRVSLTVRAPYTGRARGPGSTCTDPLDPEDQPLRENFRLAENRSTALEADCYERQTVATEVTLRNMLSRSYFIY
jgi:prepilin-type N-terminal cleavage/methylation domain-containing protein